MVKDIALSQRWIQFGRSGVLNSWLCRARNMFSARVLFHDDLNNPEESRSRSRLNGKSVPKFVVQHSLLFSISIHAWNAYCARKVTTIDSNHKFSSVQFHMFWKHFAQYESAESSLNANSACSNIHLAQVIQQQQQQCRMWGVHIFAVVHWQMHSDYIIWVVSQVMVLLWRAFIECYTTATQIKCWLNWKDPMNIYRKVLEIYLFHFPKTVFS